MRFSVILLAFAASAYAVSVPQQGVAARGLVVRQDDAGGDTPLLVVIPEPVPVLEAMILAELLVPLALQPQLVVLPPPDPERARPLALALAPPLPPRPRRQLPRLPPQPRPVVHRASMVKLEPSCWLLAPFPPSFCEK